MNLAITALAKNCDLESAGDLFSAELVTILNQFEGKPDEESMEDDKPKEPPYYSWTDQSPERFMFDLLC